MAGRKASSDVINFLGDLLPFLYGGSADLSVSDLTMMKNYPIVTPGDFRGRNIKFGVREFGMATIATGMAQSGMILPYIGTFFTFSDYMRNAIRLCALMKEHVIYQFTHDSIFLGEDGPTHQPIEHYAALQSHPLPHVIRPGDSNEVKMAWIAALRYRGPTALLLSRQNLPDLEQTKVPYAEGVGPRRLHHQDANRANPTSRSLQPARNCILPWMWPSSWKSSAKQVRVISMPCWEIV